MKFPQIDYLWLERVDCPNSALDFLKRARYYLIEKETPIKERPADFMGYLVRSLLGLAHVDKYAFYTVIYVLMAHDMDYTLEACTGLYAKLFDRLVPMIAIDYEDKEKFVEEAYAIMPPTGYGVDKVKDLVYQIKPCERSYNRLVFGV